MAPVPPVMRTVPSPQPLARPGPVGGSPAGTRARRRALGAQAGRTASWSSASSRASALITCPAMPSSSERGTSITPPQRSRFSSASVTASPNLRLSWADRLVVRTGRNSAAGDSPHGSVNARVAERLRERHGGGQSPGQRRVFGVGPLVGHQHGQHARESAGRRGDPGRQPGPVRLFPGDGQPGHGRSVGSKSVGERLRGQTPPGWSSGSASSQAPSRRAGAPESPSRRQPVRYAQESTPSRPASG